MKPITLPQMSNPVDPEEYIITQSIEGFQVLLEVDGEEVEIVSPQVRHKYALTELKLILMRQADGEQFFVHQGKIIGVHDVLES